MPPELGCHDDFGNVVRVAVDRHATLEDLERDAFLLQVTIIGAQECRELGAGGMSTDEDSLGIATITGDVPGHPTKRFGDVADQHAHFHAGQETVVRRDEDKSPLVSALGFSATSLLSPPSHPPP